MQNNQLTDHDLDAQMDVAFLESGFVSALLENANQSLKEEQMPKSEASPYSATSHDMLAEAKADLRRNLYFAETEIGRLKGERIARIEAFKAQSRIDQTGADLEAKTEIERVRQEVELIERTLTDRRAKLNALSNAHVLNMQELSKKHTLEAAELAKQFDDQIEAAEKVMAMSDAALLVGSKLVN